MSEVVLDDDVRVAPRVACSWIVQPRGSDMDRMDWPASDSTAYPNAACRYSVAPLMSICRSRRPATARFPAERCNARICSCGGGVGRRTDAGASSGTADRARSYMVDGR
ncbi:hypothetical protein DVA67_033490 [Solirubrobacter sp. CPCC 204708]|nr:hypothetical protein [Solirubrobacter deserti]